MGTDPGPGKVIAHRADPDGAPFYTATADGAGTFLFRVHGHFDFEVSAGLDELRLFWDPAEEPAGAGVYVTGTVMAFLRTLAGFLTLHGSAVRAHGADLPAIAFLGPSGAGKTTVAALALASGYGVLSDDVLCIDPSGGPARMLRGSDELRIRPEAAWALDAFPPDASVTTRVTSDGRVAVRARDGDGGAGDVPVHGVEREDPSVRLAALVIPVPDRTCGAVQVERLSAADALLAVASQPRLTGWIDRTILARQFAAIGDLVADVPVVRARLPWMPADAGRGVAALLDDVLAHAP